MEQLVVMTKHKTVELHVHRNNHRLPHKAGLEEMAIPKKRDNDLDNIPPDHYLLDLVYVVVDWHNKNAKRLRMS